MTPRSHRAARRSDCDRRIHAAVHALLAERGMRLSMDAVAERAGCSKQTLYNYYGCKENLLRDVLQDHVHLAAGPLGTVSGDLHADLLAFALAHLDRLNNPDVLQTCRLVEAESHRFPTSRSRSSTTAWSACSSAWRIASNRRSTPANCGMTIRTSWPNCC